MLCLWISQLENRGRFWQPRAVTIMDDFGAISQAFQTEDGGTTLALAVGIADLTADQITVLDADPAVVAVPGDTLDVTLFGGIKAQTKTKAGAILLAGAKIPPQDADSLRAAWDKSLAQISTESVSRLAISLFENFSIPLTIASTPPK